MARKAPGQPPERGGGVAGAEPRLEIGDLEAGMTGDGLRPGQPLPERRHAVNRLQRVLRADQPPDLVEPEARQGLQADLAMALVGRVERPAEQPDAPAGTAGRRLVAAWAAHRPVTAGGAHASTGSA